MTGVAGQTVPHLPAEFFGDSDGRFALHQVELCLITESGLGQGLSGT